MNTELKPDGTGPLVVLARFRSKSNPSKVHEVRVGSDEKVYCTCWGWLRAHTQGIEKDCRHMAAWRASGTKGDA